MSRPLARSASCAIRWGFQKQLLDGFEHPGLQPAEYEDLVEQQLYAFQQYTWCDFMLDRMVGCRDVVRSAGLFESSLALLQ